MAVVKAPRKGGVGIPGGEGVRKVRTNIGRSSERALNEMAYEIDKAANEFADNIDRWQASRENGEKRDYDIAYAEWQRQDEIERAADPDFINHEKETQGSYHKFLNSQKQRTGVARDYVATHRKAKYEPYRHKVKVNAVKEEAARQRVVVLPRLADNYIEDTAKTIAALEAAGYDPEAVADIEANNKNLFEAQARDTAAVGNVHPEDLPGWLELQQEKLKEARTQEHIQILEDLVSSNNIKTAADGRDIINAYDYLDDKEKGRIRRIMEDAVDARDANEKIEAAETKEATFQLMHTHRNAGKYDLAIEVVRTAAHKAIFTPEEQGRYMDQINKLATVRGNGHPTASDGVALKEWYQAENAHRKKELTDDQLFQKMLELGPKIDATTFEQGIKDVYKLPDPDDPLTQQSAQTYYKLLLDMRNDEKLGDDAAENALNYNIHYEELTKWGRKNPDATPKEWADKWNQVMEPVAKKWLFDFTTNIMRKYVSPVAGAGFALRDVQKFRKATQPKSAELPTPKTKAEYDKLPAGTRYIHPDLGEQVKQ